MVRAVIEVIDFNASSGVTLPTVAAEGTLNHRRQLFNIYTDGIRNPKIPPLIASVSGKVFDVENYALYQAIMPGIIAILEEPQTELSVNPIAIEPGAADSRYVEVPILAFALYQLAAGKNCVAAQERFAQSPDNAALIASTYLSLAGTCDSSKPKEVHRLQARELLSGIKIR